MRILSKKTVTYLQSNEYGGEFVQKARIPEIPSGVEHCFAIWKVIQDAKQKSECGMA